MEEFHDFGDESQYRSFIQYDQSYEFDFEIREGEMDREFDKGLKYKSNVSTNLRKQHPR